MLGVESVDRFNADDQTLGRVNLATRPGSRETTGEHRGEMLACNRLAAQALPRRGSGPLAEDSDLLVGDTGPTSGGSCRDGGDRQSHDTMILHRAPQRSHRSIIESQLHELIGT